MSEHFNYDGLGVVNGIDLDDYVGVVVNSARKVHTPRGVLELDDLIAIGCAALAVAAQRYRADQGAKFSTFASTRVRGAMLDEVRRLDWVPRRERVRARRGEADPEQFHKMLARELDMPEPSVPFDNDGAIALSERFSQVTADRSERETEILRLRYLCGWPLGAIAARLGVTTQRVCQIERQARDRMRERFPELVGAAVA